jgi:hypothetical protein
LIGYLRRLILRNLVSPYGLAMASCCLFIFAWAFPPGFYTRYALEPDLLHRNTTVLVFFSICVAAFLSGVRLMGFRGDTDPVWVRPKLQFRSDSVLMYLLVPLVLTGAFCFIYLVLITGSINFVALVFSRQGDVIKQSITGRPATGYWGSTLFLLTAALWWAAYRSTQVKLNGTSKRIYRVVFLSCFAVDGMTCLATFDRTNLMPLLAGIAVIYFFFKTSGSGVKLVRLALSSFLAVLAILSAFVALQIARGSARVDGVIASVFGYTIVSYNRLAALMLGVMHYAYRGKGGYLVAFLTENERFHAIREQMGLPNSYQLWLSEFPSVQMSGLNSAYNWAGVFGYLYSDVGWWTPLYLCAAGIIAGFLWSRFRAGTTFGIVLYPWMAFWILFWFGWNLLLDARGVVLIEASVLFFIYDRLNLAPARLASPASTAVLSSWEPVRSLSDSSRKGFD